MESATHRIADLFRQLGLPDTHPEIERFLATHRLPKGIALADAPFWSPSQAQFLREEIFEDADWAGIVDQLSARLSG